jgi:IS1 family transposase
MVLFHFFFGGNKKQIWQVFYGRRTYNCFFLLSKFCFSCNVQEVTVHWHNYKNIYFSTSWRFGILSSGYSRISKSIFAISAIFDALNIT